MRVVAIDPGLTIGVAEVTTNPLRVVTFATDDPIEVVTFLTGTYDAVVVENFVGGGPRTKEAIHTLKVLGFVQYYAQFLGLPVTLQQPQMRKHKVSEAKSLLKTATPHEIDALAHALALVARILHSATCGSGTTV